MSEQMFKLEIRGVEELRRALEELPKKLSKEVTTQALKAGGKVLAQAMKANVPRKSSRLAESIKVAKIKGLAGTFDDAVSVGPTLFYGLFVEKGHRLMRTVRRYRRRAGGREYREMKQVGFVPARPFIRPAFDTHKEPAVKAVADRWVIALTRGFAKLEKMRGGGA